MNATVLFSRTVRGAPYGRKTRGVFKASGGLHYIKGNKSPYFSITAEVHRLGFPDQEWSGGCLHDEILRLEPKFADLVALHLSDIEGAPMHAESNGKYWLEIAAELRGSLREPDAAAILARHLRATAEETAGMIEQAKANRSAGTIVADYVAAARERWKAEAQSCIEAHGLTVYGDKWESGE